MRMKDRVRFISRSVKSSNAEVRSDQEQSAHTSIFFNEPYSNWKKEQRESSGSDTRHTDKKPINPSLMVSKQ